MKFLKEFVRFLYFKKKLWLLPLILLILLLGIFLVLSEGSILAPLIYTLF